MCREVEVGNDRVYGERGADTLNGGDGDDIVFGGDDNDQLVGGNGIDQLTGGNGDDTLDGNSGDDTLDGGAGSDVLDGSTGEDTLDGGDGDDTLYGRADNDALGGGAGNDVLHGGGGDDVVYGGSGDDSLYGQDGDDTLNGDGGVDQVWGNAGDDIIDVSLDNESDIVYAGSQTISDLCTYDFNIDALSDCETEIESWPVQDDADCVALQAGIPVIAAGYTLIDTPISSSDAIWPSETNLAAGGGNVIFGYMWVPEGWSLTASGAYVLSQPTGGFQHLERQLNGTGTGGIASVTRDGNRVVELNSPAGPLNERGSMPTLSRLPSTTVEHGGNFQLVGMNFWRGGEYMVSLEHGIAPHPNTPDAPFVEPPCVVFEDIVPGFGPNFDGVWGRLSIVEEEVRAAIVAAYNIAAGCIAAIEGFAGSIVEAVRLLDEFLANPDAFISTQVAEIKAAVEAAVDDPDAAVGDFVKASLQLDLLRENPAQWVGSVGCEIILEVLLSMTGAGAAALVARITEEVLDFINARRRAAGEINPRIACQNNSFPEGTPVLLVDGSYAPIEDIRPGEWVVGFDEADGVWGSFEVLDQWSAIDEYAMATVWFDDGSSVTATAGHEFFVEGDGWVPLGNVESGDALRSPESSPRAAVVSVEPEELVEVFELDVAIADSFVVSSSSVDVLVHNQDNDFVLDDPSTWSADPEVYRKTFDSLDAGTKRALSEAVMAKHGEWPTGDTQAQRDWFDGLDAGELRVAMSEPALRDRIKTLLRGGNNAGKHEWIPVSHAVSAKEFGLSAAEITSFGTLTRDTGGTRFFFNEDGTPELDADGNHRSEPWTHADPVTSSAFHKRLYEIAVTSRTAREALDRIEALVDTEFTLNSNLRPTFDALVAERQVLWADTVTYPDRCE